MKKKVAKGLSFFIIGYVLLFALRLGYGYIEYPELLQENNNLNYSNSNFQDQVVIRNYASAKQSKEIGNTQSLDIEQKFEKVSNISSTSSKFTQEETAIRSLISKYNGLIQFEENSGVNNYRFLKLAIGVNPEQFDTFISEAKGIGKIQSFSVNKTDKTNEYKNLNAQKIALENNRTALLKLKEQGGSIDELITLEDKILSIDNQLQSLGVNLGEFDSENEFCTVNFSLSETEQAKSDTLYRIKTAFEWTTKYYATLCFVTLFASLSSLAIVVILQKLKIGFKVK